MSKYGNKKIKVDGEEYDSQAEYLYHLHYREREQRGEIRNLKRQVKYVIQPSFKRDGSTIRAITYTVDYDFEEAPDWKHVTVVVKGFATEVFKLKRKLFLYRYPEIELRIEAA